MHAPFVVIEYGAFLIQDSHHRLKAASLPSDIFFMRHRIIVIRITFDEFRLGPFAATAIFETVTGAVLDVVRWAGNDQIN